MHIKYLNKAYEQAVLAFNSKEVPVGCVIVQNNKIISQSHNLTNKCHSSLAHAELNALKNIEDNYKSLIFYITCEPCVMCMNILERLDCTVYYGCKNDRFGGTSVISFEKNWLINLEDEKCYKILQLFYKRENEFAPENKRKKKYDNRL